jgi:hypothetical protein
MYMVVLCSFLFERVPILSPQETIRGHLASSPKIMHMGGIVAANRQKGGPLRPSMINFFTGGIGRFRL